MAEAEEPTQIIAAQKTSEADQAWIRHQREVLQKTPERVEDSAKFLSGMISISLTIFLNLEPKAFEGLAGAAPLKIVAGLWLLSLLCTFAVLFPAPYRYHDASADSIQAMHRRVARYKYRLLGLGALLFVAALGVLAWVYVWR
jgi:hypothetical protein